MFTGVRRRGGASRNRDEKWKLQQDWENDPDAFSGEELQRRPEVRMIKYALVMAYVRFGVRALGALTLLWVTMVLLGGFVSSLRKIDFWCLTMIAFVHAAGLVLTEFNSLSLVCTFFFL
ncbi:hypothetical protein CFC21_032715 [Triticum aestivum]|uniref:Uncharacterized protein n=2 Tax=Triticum aestivum TaxID=4565 RepID=A0A3B6DMT3_WHEAT|nr:hypothetical protein CFC21_032715 [Triticum aestivum]